MDGQIPDSDRQSHGDGFLPRVAEKSGLFKNLRIRQEINLVPVCLGLADGSAEDHSSSAIVGMSPFIMVMMDIAVAADLDIQISRQGVYNGRTYTVKSSTGLICRIVKFTSCMKGGKYQSFCGDCLSRAYPPEYLVHYL